MKVGQKRMKIGFFGHFGTLNPGNEATLVAILSRLRVVYPDRAFCCICTYPEVATARYGIEAAPINNRSGPYESGTVELGWISV